jgi:hypothetical protein
MKIRSNVIIEWVPTHDGATPCFTAWDKQEPSYRYKDEPWFPEAHPDWTPLTRPAFSIQLYDATVPASFSRDEAAEYVRRRADRLWNAHVFNHPEHHFRLDVYGLSIDPSASDEELAARCVAHQRKEVAARLATVRTDMYVPRYWDEQHWRRTGFLRGLIVIAETDYEQWNDGDGGLLRVWWDRASVSAVATDELQVCRMTLGELHDKVTEDVADDFVSNINWFYACYVQDGGLGAELKMAVRMDKGEKEGETTKVDA